MKHIFGWPTRLVDCQIIAQAAGSLALLPLSDRSGNLRLLAKPSRTQRTSSATHRSRRSRSAKGSSQFCRRIASRKVANCSYARSCPTKVRKKLTKQKLLGTRLSGKLVDRSFVRLVTMRAKLMKQVNLKYRWQNGISIRRALSFLSLRGIPGWN